MTLVIDKGNKRDASKILSEKLRQKKMKGNLANHFGKLKRNIDGLTYQIAVRD